MAFDLLIEIFVNERSFACTDDTAIDRKNEMKFNRPLREIRYQSGRLLSGFRQ